MYTKVLVPLDGSSLAEDVIPHVNTIARGCDALTVVFLRVVEPTILLSDDSGSNALKWDVAEKMNATAQQEAQQYLAEIAARAAQAGLETQSVVLLGRPAETICAFAGNNGVDLIVMATHGRSGIRRLVWGGVADKVLRSCRAPVLLVKTGGGEPSS